MSILHHHTPGGRRPFEDATDVGHSREAELLAERRDLCTQLALARSEADRLRAENSRLHSELSHAHRQLQKRWWQR
jgi:hypothetical protein